MFSVRQESVDQPDIRMLIEALDDYQKPLYPAESHHGIDFAALSRPNVLFLVARDTQQIAIGCGALVMEAGYGELKRMFTTPAARGKGVARALLGGLELLAARRGCTVYRLETGYLQPEAITLYEKAGYVRRGPFGAYTEDPNSVFMEKPGLPAGYTLRVAGLADVGELDLLIGASARGVGAQHYAEAVIEGALQGAFGVDTQLLRDGTYFAVEHHGRIVAAGGWGRRRTLFGSDARSGREPELLDPNIDRARIRAFFVHPDHVRRGLGTALLCASEAAARKEGFLGFEMMATLTGRPLYQRFGYVGDTAIHHPVGENLTIEFYPMARSDVLPA